jgi:4-hydroxybenzoate polyprenyltransferase
MPPPTPADPDLHIPLCVGLVGTLIKTDLLYESFIVLCKRNPLMIGSTLVWLARGRAHLKAQIAERVSLDPALLPYHEPFLAFLREAKARGRKLILVTSSARKLVLPIAGYLDLFDEVLTGDGTTNLPPAARRQLLVERFGERGFDYAGHSPAELPVWAAAREALVVQGSPRLAVQAARRAKLGPAFPASAGRLRALARALRPHQWAKNLIIFIPTLTAHRLGDPALVLRDAWAFASFSLCASGVYILNDLMDLEADRRHVSKNRRPFAAGDLPLLAGLVLGPLLLGAGFLLAVHVSWLLAGVTALYLVLTTSYTLWVKRVVLLDVFFLAGLYTIRLIAGHAASGIPYSAWLLIFSMFIFLSLALVKRFVELRPAKPDEAGRVVGAGRGYRVDDLAVVTSLGTGSGYLAALVLALYGNSQEVVILYRHPTLLLLVCPLLLFWISRVWLLAHRGQMHDDPVVFALKDRVSYLVGLLALVVLWVATGR